MASPVRAAGSKGTVPSPGLSPAPGESRDENHRPLRCRETRPHTEDFVYLIFFFSSRLLKYSDKSCHRGGTTEEGDMGGWLAKGTCPGCWPVPEERRDDKLN